MVNLHTENFEREKDASESLGTETYECQEVQNKSEQRVDVLSHKSIMKYSKTKSVKMLKFRASDRKALIRPRASRRRNGYVSLRN